jgi:hypothetical protein
VHPDFAKALCGVLVVALLLLAWMFEIGDE